MASARLANTSWVSLEAKLVLPVGQLTTCQQHVIGVGVTLNQSLFETVLHALLIDGRDFTVEMYQGNGAKWNKSRQVLHP